MSEAEAGIIRSTVTMSLESVMSETYSRPNLAALPPVLPGTSARAVLSAEPDGCVCLCTQNPGDGANWVRRELVRRGLVGETGSVGETGLVVGSGADVGFDEVQIQRERVEAFGAVE